MRVLQRKLLKLKSIGCGRSRTSKGYSLIEVTIAISLSIMIILMFTEFIQIINKSYRQFVQESKQHFYINEAFRFFDVQLNDAVKKIDVTSDSITFIKYKKQNVNRNLAYSELDFSSIDVNRINLRGSELQIEYTNSSTSVALLLNVEVFKVEKIKERLFITLKMKEGQYYTRCYDLKYIEN